MASTVFIDWPQAIETGLQKLAREALAEPGVATVELLDDARSRILWEEKNPAVLADEVRAETRQHRIERRHRQAPRLTHRPGS
ncbi:conserved hypothetical protein [Frankia sp. Hr75.2]|nr:conserved hypothetical protein [Frankia sp. Hr75.2]